MPRTTSHPKEENFNFRVPADLKAAFKAATDATDRPAAQVLRDFMRSYVAANAEADAAHDAWFRAGVEEGLRERGPGIPHERVMAEMKARLEKRIAKARKRAR
jgi:predicted transcriptional regulator